jgi:peptidoglycan hydrolase-like protein with peptidoglycan-binding domain
MAAVLLRPLFLTSPMMHGDDVRAVQAALVRGASTLKVDGVFGRATDAAVRGFQRNAGLSHVDGIVGPETWETLFGADTVIIQQPAAHTDAARLCLDRFLAAGWSMEQACGILGNIQNESAFNPAAPGDGGAAYGLCQWHRDRQAAFRARMGRAIQGSTVEQQADFISFEMLQGTEQLAGRRLKTATSPEQAADIVCRDYERPADKDGQSRKRMQSARAFFAAFAATPPTPAPPAAPIPTAPAHLLSPRAVDDLMRPHTARPGGTPWSLTGLGVAVDGQSVAPDPAAIQRLDGLWSRYAAILPISSPVPVELVMGLLDLFAESGATRTTLLPGADKLAPERTPERVAVGPLQVTLATARTALGRPDLTLAALESDDALALSAGVKALALRARETLLDPPLAAAAHLADGLFLDNNPQNRWGLAQGGPVKLIDRFLSGFNAAMQVSAGRSPPSGSTSMHGLIEMVTAPTAFASTGPYRAEDPESFIGGAFVGNSRQCVALVQAAAHAPLTKFWKEGPKVRDDPPQKGVAIATFQNGHYLNDTHGLSHAALFLAMDGDGFFVVDQWDNARDHHPPQKRRLPFVHPPGPFNTPANQGGAFSIIM